LKKNNTTTNNDSGFAATDVRQVCDLPDAASLLFRGFAATDVRQVCDLPDAASLLFRGCAASLAAQPHVILQALAGEPKALRTSKRRSRKVDHQSGGAAK